MNFIHNLKIINSMYNQLRRPFYNEIIHSWKALLLFLRILSLIIKWLFNKILIYASSAYKILISYILIIKNIVLKINLRTFLLNVFKTCCFTYKTVWINNFVVVKQILLIDLRITQWSLSIKIMRILYKTHICYATMKICTIALLFSS
jgi:hypothetical protein